MMNPDCILLYATTLHRAVLSLKSDCSRVPGSQSDSEHGSVVAGASRIWAADTIASEVAQITGGLRRGTYPALRRRCSRYPQPASSPSRTGEPLDHVQS